MAREPRYPEASVASHAATGAIEGAVGIYGTEPLWRRYVEKKPWHNPFRDTLKGHARKIAIGAVVGAAATAPIGMIVEEIRRHRARKAKKVTTTMEAEMDQALTEFRKIYKITEDQEGEPTVITLPGKSRILAGLSGAGIGAAAGAAGGAGFGLLLPGLIKRLGKRPAKFAHKIESALGGPIGSAVKIGIPTAGITAHQAVMNVNEDIRESEAIKRAIRKAKREGRKERQLEALRPGMITFMRLNMDKYEEPYSVQKSGYRLDKYKKTIKAKEIDRKISDQVRAASLGAAGGALFPKGGSVGRRAIIGALAGSGVAAGVQYNTPTDVYGEQSETAKVVQRRIIQAGGAAAILGGLLARKRKIMSGIKKLRPRL
jgi:hypothetical protein